MRCLFSFLLFVVLVFPAAAVEPDEMLEDPVLEARARNLSSELRCMVCQNESIDDSNAELARDLRILLRQRILAGDTDAQVLDYIVSRYGEFVLLRPRFNARNALLWGAPVIFLLGGGSLAILTFRRRRAGGASPKLSDQEEAELKRIIEGSS